MKKRLGYLNLLFALPLLSGCGHEHTFANEWTINDICHYHASTCEHTDLKIDEAEHTFVDGVCSVCGYEQSIAPHTHTYSDKWTSDETGHWHTATCEHIDLINEFAEHVFENGVCTICGFIDVNYKIWTEAEKQIFKDHLYGFELPYINDLTAEWDEQNECVIVSGALVTLDSFNDYVNNLVKQGFDKQSGPYENTYILLKEVNVGGTIKTIDIDIFIDNNSRLYAICYDPFCYEWPIDVIDDYYENYFYIAPKTTVPSLEADKYFIDTNYLESDSILAIDCYSNVNLESSYKEILTQKGFTVSEFKNEDGLFVANEPDEIIQVFFAYNETNNILTIIISPSQKGWPSLVVDYYTDQLTNNSGTRVPKITGADSYEFIDVFDRYGYFFVLCETDINFESSYATKLEENYTVYSEKVNTAGNYYAVSDNNDLLVQYKYIVVESAFGGKDYTHFDVLFEKFYPHNEEHLATGFELIQPGTKTTLPDFPGVGEKIIFSDTNKYMTITIQAATYTSVSEYVSALIDEDWSVKEVNSVAYNYQAISADRDIFMEISIVDGRITLTLSAYADPIAVWPTDGINEILNTLDIHGEIPVFDGALGYDYENDTDHHDIICVVPYGKEQELIDAYYKKLTDLGWRKVDIDDENFYYVINGSTIGLTAYTEYAGEGKVFINIQLADGDRYDVDARQTFIDWKISTDLDSDIQIPGINLSSKVIDSQIISDEGKTYSGYYLFEILLDMGDADVDSLITEVINQFLLDNWVYSSDDKFYHKNDCFMNCYKNLGSLAIDICVPVPDRSLLGITKSFISKLKSPFCNTKIPETLDVSSEPTIEVDTFSTGSWFNLYLFLSFDSSTICKTVMNEIATAFKGLGWTEDEYSDTNDIILIDSTGEVQLELYRSGNSSSELHYEIERKY